MSTHVGIFCLNTGYCYPTLMTPAQFVATDRSSLRWAKLIEIDNGNLVDEYPSRVGAGVLATSAVAAPVAPAAPSAVPAAPRYEPVAREHISLNWAAQNAFIAFAMDNGGQIRAFTEMPDANDVFGNFYVNRIRQAGDMSGCYGTVMIPEQVNALNPALELRPAINVAVRDSLVVRPAQVDARVAGYAGDAQGYAGTDREAEYAGDQQQQQG